MKLSRQCQRTVRALVLALMVSTGPVAAAASGATPAATSASTCATAWGSVVKHRGHSTTKPVTNVRSGQHRCFDRLVIDLGGTGRGRPGFQAKFVRHVRMDGTGADVPLRGGAKLRIIVKAPAYDDAGDPTYEPADANELVDVSGYRTFRQAAWAGTYEGQTTIGVGVRARLPMRVFVLNGPRGERHLVLDVAHSWS